VFTKKRVRENTFSLRVCNEMSARDFYQNTGYALVALTGGSLLPFIYFRNDAVMRRYPLGFVVLFLIQSIVAFAKAGNTDKKDVAAAQDELIMILLFFMVAIFMASVAEFILTRTAGPPVMAVLALVVLVEIIMLGLVAASRSSSSSGEKE
jgi:hypothetical protein